MSNQSITREVLIDILRSNVASTYEAHKHDLDSSGCTNEDFSIAMLFISAWLRHNRDVQEMRPLLVKEGSAAYPALPCAWRALPILQHFFVLDEEGFRYLDAISFDDRRKIADSVAESEPVFGVRRLKKPGAAPDPVTVRPPAEATEG